MRSITCDRSRNERWVCYSRRNANYLMKMFDRPGNVVDPDVLSKTEAWPAHWMAEGAGVKEGNPTEPSASSLEEFLLDALLTLPRILIDEAASGWTAVQELGKYDDLFRNINVQTNLLDVLQKRTAMRGLPSKPAYARKTAAQFTNYPFEYYLYRLRAALNDALRIVKSRKRIYVHKTGNALMYTYRLRVVDPATSLCKQFSRPDLAS